MKFQPDHLAGTNAITRHEGSAVWVNNQRHGRSLLVPWRGAVQSWSPRVVADLVAGHFEQALALKPEVLIFGSGERLQFVAPGLHRALIAARVGVETMDTAAACRTFNVLASEGRAVVAALLLDPGPTGVPARPAPL